MEDCTRSWLLALLTAGLSACGDGTTPQTPTAPPSTSGLFTVTGRVLERTPQGVQPLASARVWYEYVRPGDTFTTGGVWQTDASGTYVFPHVPYDTTLWLRGDAQSGIHGRRQPCGSAATVRADTILDIELVAPGGEMANQAPPTLSGVVYEQTTEGRRPLAGLAVGFVVHSLTAPYTWTDSDGRYFLCRLPFGSGRLHILVVATFDGVGDVIKEVPVTVAGNAVLDIDVTR